MRAKMWLLQNLQKKTHTQKDEKLSKRGEVEERVTLNFKKTREYSECKNPFFSRKQLYMNRMWYYNIYTVTSSLV